MYYGVPDALVLLNKKDQSIKTIVFDANGLEDYEISRAKDLILRYMNQKYKADYSVKHTIHFTEVQYFIYRKGKLQFKYFPAIKGKQVERLVRTRIFDDEHIVSSDIDISKLNNHIDIFAEIKNSWNLNTGR